MASLMSHIFFLLMVFARKYLYRLTFFGTACFFLSVKLFFWKTHFRYITFNNIAGVQNSSVNISSIPSTADGPITWHQTVTIYCSWVPGNRMYGDMAVKGEEGAGRTIWNDPLYGDIVGLEGFYLLNLLLWTVVGESATFLNKTIFYFFIRSSMSWTQSTSNLQILYRDYTYLLTMTRGQRHWPLKMLLPKTVELLCVLLLVEELQIRSLCISLVRTISSQKRKSLTILSLIFR